MEKMNLRPSPRIGILAAVGLATAGCDCSGTSREPQPCPEVPAPPSLQEEQFLNVMNDISSYCDTIISPGQDDAGIRDKGIFCASKRNGVVECRCLEKEKFLDEKARGYGYRILSSRDDVFIVQQGDKEFHTDDWLNPLYEERYDHVWVFIEGAAVVKKGDHEFHIDKTGKPLYPGTFDKAWPFQEGIAVVRDEGREFHIGRDGEPLYTTRYDSAGSFVDFSAIVQSGSLQHFINLQGDITATADLSKGGMLGSAEKICPEGGHLYSCPLMAKDGKFFYVQ